MGRPTGKGSIVNWDKSYCYKCEQQFKSPASLQMHLMNSRNHKHPQIAKPLTVLLSIHPEHVEKISSGEKKYEFGKTAWRGKKVYIYSTSPVQRIIGCFTSNEKNYAPVGELWSGFHEHSGLDKPAFDDYFAGHEKGYAIKIDDLEIFDPPLDPNSIFHGFRAPQRFKYLSDGEIARLEWALNFRVDCYLVLLKRYRQNFTDAHFEIITSRAGYPGRYLAPSKGLLKEAGVMAYNKKGDKHPKIPFEEYEKLYIAEINKHPAAWVRLKELFEMGRTKKVFLVCKERDKYECHRIIVWKLLVDMIKSVKSPIVVSEADIKPQGLDLFFPELMNKTTV